MKETMENAREELKRIDHLIYVTLKYTRTVDVFLSIIERMISTYEFLVDALLKLAISQGKAYEEPDIPLAKAQLVQKLYDSKKIKDSIEHYLMLRKLRRANYERSSEFRRHVTMTSLVEGKVIKVDIDSITQDFHNLRDFVDYVDKKISEK
jgi:hypothetical protein